ncbi:signal peptidase I [Labedella phragmitis]|uniref:Signal peptidase I n=1 Tax=Labedella phragmitis TaxID=2498849 RepID=A0A3S5CF81_9MICO|nr:signal peptidase I [Labedella phragmitis]RWZ52414.1 signal peptidase I [Labedella phragmitis]
MDERRNGIGPEGPSWRAGRPWFVASLVAQSYLTLIASLAAVAIVPVFLGWSATVVQSGSMEPSISPGDVVLTAPVQTEREAPLGRVVSFISPADAEPDGVEKIRLHRIVDVNDDGTFVTAGDANADVDSTPIARDQIIGEGRLLVPAIGLPSWWIGRGETAPLALWVGLTAASLVVAWGAPSARPIPLRRERHAAAGVEDPASAGDGDDASSSPSSSESADAGPPADVGRRSLLSGIGAIAVLGLAGLPREPSSAAFTASTSTGGSWRVAALVRLDLGRATTYALLARSSVSNLHSHGATWIDGDIGTSPGTSVTGFGSSNVSGTTERNTTAARNAMADAVALADALGERTPGSTLAPTLSGTMFPGVYATADDVHVSGALTLDARGDSSAVFILRSRNLTAGASALVRLTNGARAGNVYWRATSSVTLARDSGIVGTILADGDVTMAHGSQATGRLFSLSGAVSIDRATVLVP